MRGNCLLMFISLNFFWGIVSTMVYLSSVRGNGCSMTIKVIVPWNLAGKKASVAGFQITVSIPFKIPKYLNNYTTVSCQKQWVVSYLQWKSKKYKLVIRIQKTALDHIKQYNNKCFRLRWLPLFFICSWKRAFITMAFVTKFLIQIPPRTTRNNAKLLENDAQNLLHLCQHLN